MNDEIKEIIEHIKTYPEKMYCLSEKEKIRILDYITNLKHYYHVNVNKYERLIEKYSNLQKENLKLISENEAIKNIKYTVDEVIYKSRIDKAIEFVETNPLTWKPNMDLTKLIENPNLKDRMFYTPDEWLHQLHIILKGDDENGN